MIGKAGLSFNVSLNRSEGLHQGVRTLVDLLALAPVKPRFCIVGEPTGMQVATGHKGKIALRATCTGREGHSALAPMALNALHLAADFVTVVRNIQARVAAEGLRDGDYDVPYTTLHVGKMSGGVQVNIVPNHAVLDFEKQHGVGALGDMAGYLIKMQLHGLGIGIWHCNSCTGSPCRTYGAK